MDSPLRLTARDRWLLALLCLALYGFTLLNPRTLNPHETTHCLNVREMMRSGEWLIPTYGGRPWLERPPLPHWMTYVGVAIRGEDDAERAYRLSSISVATLAVVVFASCIGGCFGRGPGLLSGALLATMREWHTYATGPEADIFLASTVTIACSLLMRGLFDPQYRETRTSLLGRRSWPIVSFFLLTGLMNAMKGPFFGLFFTLLPLGVFFAWQRRGLRPLVWLPGVAVALALGLAWPILAWVRYPDIVELWAVDYGVRWRQGYLGEPFWYYLVNQPYNVFPWTIPAIVGLATTWKRIRQSDEPALRYVWCWAIVPVLFFSLFKGKHHHYMLSCMAPAAVLSAMGLQAIWRSVPAWPRLVRSPALPLVVLGIPCLIAGVLFWSHIPGPASVRLAWMVGMPLLGALTWLLLAERQVGIALGGLTILFAAFHCAFYEYRSVYLETFAPDVALLHDAPGQIDGPLFVLAEEEPLSASWPMFYLNGRANLLHNASYLRDDSLPRDAVYLIARPRDEKSLAEFGTTTVVAQSEKSRSERSPADRYTLYRLEFHADLVRVRADVRMTPNQATGRAKGPYLEPSRHVSATNR